jgi:hypothetical protein
VVLHNSFADAIGHFGNAGSGVLVGPGMELWDLSAIKNIKFGERASFQFRAEFFNASTTPTSPQSPPT